MTLRISLRDGEKLVVNGSVLTAHGRVTLGIESKATILRGSDLMAAHEADTPARKLYYACVQAYIDPDHDELHHEAILVALKAVMQTLQTAAAAAVCGSFARRVALGEHYRALADCRQLMEMEATRPGAAPRAGNGGTRLLRLATEPPSPAATGGSIAGVLPV